MKFNCLNKRQPYKDLLELVRWYDKERSPEVLFLGDSVVERISWGDSNRLSLGQMLERELGQSRLGTISRSGYNPIVFYHLILALGRLKRKPRVLVLPVNMRCFSPQWDLNPLWQFTREIEVLKRFTRGRASDLGLGADPEEDPVLFERFDAAEVDYPGTPYRRIGEFRSRILQKPVTVEETAFRLRQIFIFHYLYPLDYGHRKLVFLRQAAKEIVAMGIQPFFYFTPINYQAGSRHVGELFLDRFQKNKAVVTAAVDLASGLFRKDYSLSLGSEFFFTDDNATEHLNDAGRETLCRWIAAETQNLLRSNPEKIQEGFYCPLCGHGAFDESLPYKPKGSSPPFSDKKLVRCASCRVFSVYPLPSQDELEKHYASYWPKEAFSSHFSLFEAQAGSRRAYFEKFLPPGGGDFGVLDIGAGFGHTGLELRKNLKKTAAFYDAVEVDPEALDYLKKVVRPRNIYARLEEAEGSYHLILLSHILEHLPNPLEFLASLKNRLSDQGVLFIEVPNRDHLYKKYNEPHLIFFDPASLCALVKKAGFEVVQADTCGPTVGELRKMNAAGSGQKNPDELLRLEIEQLLKNVSQYGKDRKWIRLVARPAPPVKLSIVIGTHNRLRQLRNCMDSLDGKLGVSHEIYVIDAGSSDGTIDYLAERPWIRRVLDGKRLGQARSYNNVFKGLRSDYVCWLSDDNVVVPKVLEAAVADLERHPDIGMIGLKTKDTAGPFVYAPFIGGVSAAGILNVNQGVLRADVLRRVGFFSEDYSDYGIDPDLTAKILLAGYKVAYTKKIGVYHDRRWMNHTGSEDYERRLEKQRAAWALYEKKYSFLIDQPETSLKKAKKKHPFFLPWIARMRTSKNTLKEFTAHLTRTPSARAEKFKNTLKEILTHLMRNYYTLAGEKGRFHLFSSEAFRHNPRCRSFFFIRIRSLCYFLFSFLILKVPVLNRLAGKIKVEPAKREILYETPLSDKLLASVPFFGAKLLDLKRSCDNVKRGKFISSLDFIRSFGKNFYLVQSITQNSLQPLLSFVVTSRNDGQENETVRRMQCFVSNLLEQCRRFKLKAELVIVEWNPPPDKRRLAEVLRWPDAGEACLVRIIEVPSTLHQRFENADRLPLFQMIAKNAGIRRSRGRFVLATNIDILFSNEMIAYFASGKLKPGRMYRVDRRDVDAAVINRVLLDERLHYCDQHVLRVLRREGPLHTNACGDFTLMAKEHWTALRAYPEFPLRAMKLDGLLCYAAHYGGAREKVLKSPLKIYHMDHPVRGDGALAAIGEKDAAKNGSGVPQVSREQYHDWISRIQANRKPLFFNHERWGLCDEVLSETVIGAKNAK